LFTIGPAAWERLARDGSTRADCTALIEEIYAQAAARGHAESATASLSAQIESLRAVVRDCRQNVIVMQEKLAALYGDRDIV